MIISSHTAFQSAYNLKTFCEQQRNCRTCPFKENNFKMTNTSQCGIYLLVPKQWPLIRVAENNKGDKIEYGNITEVNYEFIKEIKEDLEKRICFLEKTCIECAEPLRKELKLIEELTVQIGRLFDTNALFRKTVDNLRKENARLNDQLVEYRYTLTDQDYHLGHYAQMIDLACKFLESGSYCKAKFDVDRECIKECHSCKHAVFTKEAWKNYLFDKCYKGDTND